MQPGYAFLNKAGRGTPSHLWVIISDPEQDPDNVMIVNLTSWKDYAECSMPGTPQRNTIAAETSVSRGSRGVQCLDLGPRRGRFFFFAASRNAARGMIHATPIL